MRNPPAVPLTTGLTLQVSAGIEQVNQPLLPLLEAWVDAASWQRLKDNWLDNAIAQLCPSSTLLTSVLAGQFEQLLLDRRVWRRCWGLLLGWSL